MEINKKTSKNLLIEIKIERNEITNGLHRKSSSHSKTSNGRLYIVLGSVCSIFLIINTILNIVTLPASSEFKPTGKQTLYTAARDSRQYCNINYKSDCVVTCQGIMDQNPGHVATEYLLSIIDQYESLCDKNWELQFYNCKFPNNTVDRNWMQVKHTEKSLPTISNLLLYDCGSLNEVEAGAFSLHPFDLTRLTLQSNTQLKRLTASITENLNKLIMFEWRLNGVMEYADVGVLHPISSHVTNMELRGGFADANLLARLVGECQDDAFPLLQIFDIRDSTSLGLEQLGGRQIVALKALKSLYMSRSGIKHLEDDIFQFLPSEILNIGLEQNSLKTLRQEVFQPLIMSGRNISIKLADNSWNCDCRLQWLQDLILNNSSKIKIFDAQNTKCLKPVSEANKPLSLANMTTCGELEAPPFNLEISCNDPITSTTTTLTTYTSPSPTHSSPNVTHTSPSSTNTSPSQTNSSPNPTHTSPSPTNTSPSPTNSSPNATHTSPSSTNTLPYLTNTTPSPTTISPIPTSTSPSSTITLPYSTSPSPSPTKTNLISTNTSPDVTNTTLDSTITQSPPNTSPSPANTTPVPTVSSAPCPLLIPFSVGATLLGVVSGAGIVILTISKNPSFLRFFTNRVNKVTGGYHTALLMPLETRDNEANNNTGNAVSNISDPSYISIIKVSSLRLQHLREWLRQSNENEVPVLSRQTSIFSIFPNTTPPAFPITGVSSYAASPYDY